MAAARSVQKLFVANLPWTVGHLELRQYFAQFGHVSSAHVVFDKNTGMSRGYGFVIFGNHGALSSATNRQNHSLEGNSLTVRSSN